MDEFEKAFRNAQRVEIFLEGLRGGPYEGLTKGFEALNEKQRTVFCTWMLAGLHFGHDFSDVLFSLFRAYEEHSIFNKMWESAAAITSSSWEKINADLATVTEVDDSEELEAES